MDRQVELGYDNEKLGRLILILSTFADAREEEILSNCRQILDSAFPDSIGHVVIDVLLHANEPMSLKEIAAKCDRGKRSVLPDGNVRVIIDRLAKAGMMLNHGTPDRPRYSLDRNDSHVQLLVKMYGPR